MYSTIWRFEDGNKFRAYEFIGIRKSGNSEKEKRIKLWSAYGFSYEFFSLSFGSMKCLWKVDDWQSHIQPDTTFFDTKMNALLRWYNERQKKGLHNYPELLGIRIYESTFDLDHISKLPENSNWKKHPSHRGKLIHEVRQ